MEPHFFVIGLGFGLSHRLELGATPAYFRLGVMEYFADRQAAGLLPSSKQ